MAIRCVKRERKETKAMEKTSIDHLNLETAIKVAAFHETVPGYEKTPLVELHELAKYLNVGKILIKDESCRFGLNAFKVLGGSYAIGHYVANRLGIPMEDLTFKQMVSKEVKEVLGELTFISATDGNHGRGVAWMAKQLGQKAIIYMPKGSAKERLERIRKEGAVAEITDMNYDDAVRKADKDAKENGWVLVQDTSWEGYETIPTHIMQGYMTLAYELYQQIGKTKPTHIFLQAGVGSFASAVTAFLTSVYGDDRPKIIIVEPIEAACIYKTLKANDGYIHTVEGDMNTIMAGLACGEPVTVGIDILRNYADYYVACEDFIAATGMRVLSSPLGKDQRIISGESGAAGFGLLYELLTNPVYENVRNKLEINETSVLVCINTEGDTDKENYRRIVWDGWHSQRIDRDN